MRMLLYVLVLLVPLACGERNSSLADSGVFSTAKRLTELKNKNLEEVSGLAASASNSGFLWAHNDSGNGAVVYLIDETLEIKLACKIKGVKNRDWEDITVGPGPVEGKNYLYVADIGDNNAKYPYKYIYRFEEPVLDGKGGEITITEFDTIVFQLEDGKKDTETIMIHPRTKDLYIISKREKPVYVYELKYPYAGDDTVTAAKIISLPLTQIVSGSISVDGKEILMKNYDMIYYWAIEGQSVGEALRTKPQVVKYRDEPQGESITFARDGSGFYTLSERIKGEKTFLYFYGRKK